MPDALTKADIIEAIQKENGYSRKQSTEATETLFWKSSSKPSNPERMS